MQSASLLPVTPPTVRKRTALLGNTEAVGVEFEAQGGAHPAVQLP